MTELLKAKKLDARGMVRSGERFFTSLGFSPLPATFWERSLFTKPADREVVCHASAWDVDNDEDLRIKMCIEITGEDFVVVHHELGHNFYQRAYRGQPYLFRNGANDGFHEAIGDAIALSVTPEYLVKIGLLDRAPDASGDIGLLLSRALEKVAFLPFGLVIDQWRWKVFSGEVKPRRVQPGVVGPAAALPGCGAARAAQRGRLRPRRQVPRARQRPLHPLLPRPHPPVPVPPRDVPGRGPDRDRCTAARSTTARRPGSELARMLAMGQSRPWPDALEALTGERRMDAGALLEYFAPAPEVAGRAEPGQEGRLVARRGLRPERRAGACGAGPRTPMST